MMTGLGTVFVRLALNNYCILNANGWSDGWVQVDVEKPMDEMMLEVAMLTTLLLQALSCESGSLYSDGTSSENWQAQKTLKPKGLCCLGCRLKLCLGCSLCILCFMGQPMKPWLQLQLYLPVSGGWCDATIAWMSTKNMACGLQASCLIAASPDVSRLCDFSRTSERCTAVLSAGVYRNVIHNPHPSLKRQSPMRF